jgi:hypothetical protein
VPSYRRRCRGGRGRGRPSWSASCGSGRHACRRCGGRVTTGMRRSGALGWTAALHVASRPAAAGRRTAPLAGLALGTRGLAAVQLSPQEALARFRALRSRCRRPEKQTEDDDDHNRHRGTSKYHHRPTVWRIALCNAGSQGFVPQLLGNHIFRPAVVDPSHDPEPSTKRADRCAPANGRKLPARFCAGPTVRDSS